MPPEINLTDHAIDRFHERVRPTLTRKQARAELLRLIPMGRPMDSMDWRYESMLNPPDYYLELADGIALAVNGTVAVTCLIRGSHSEDHRARLNLKRSIRKRRTRARRAIQGFDSKYARYDRRDVRRSDGSEESDAA